MITGVRSVGIYVGDQDRAVEFWTKTLGFELLQDTAMGNDPQAPRWIEVAPPDKSVVLVLFTPAGQEDRVGTFSNVLFRVDDLTATYRDLSGQGVHFPEEPRQEFWGPWATFADPDGNTYGLGERGD
jgi:catechol 2,3-dioxygenase-like lactoylglutathione lyase family enzyme